MNLSAYSKAIVAVVGVVLSGLNVVYGNDANIQMLISLFTALGVYHVPNK